MFWITFINCIFRSKEIQKQVNQKGMDSFVLVNMKIRWNVWLRDIILMADGVMSPFQILMWVTSFTLILYQKVSLTVCINKLHEKRTFLSHLIKKILQDTTAFQFLIASLVIRVSLKWVKMTEFDYQLKDVVD